MKEIQWRVIWFPPDRPEGTFSGSEQAVRRRAEQQTEWNPIIERREIITTPWVMEGQRRYSSSVVGKALRECDEATERLHRGQ